MKNKSPILPVICGPTASGKTALGVKLAEHIGGEIISADSRQVYRGMDIGSGKDTHDYIIDGKKIESYLIDVAEPNEIYTLHNYIGGFIESFNKIVVKGRIPIVIGGTGLYIEAILKKYVLSDIPENKELRISLANEKKEYLLSTLKDSYPDIYTRTDLSSKKRIIRSIEIGRSSKDTLNTVSYDYPSFNPLVFCVRFNRDDLVSRIEMRLRNRLEAGMIDEVKGLLSSGVSYERMMMFGMEYKFITKYLSGEINYDEMFESLFFSIRRLAKRQMTWFRGMERRGVNMTWLDGPDLDKIIHILDSIDIDNF